MAKFSIKDALMYGFSAYAKNVMLVLAVGVTAGLATWGINGVPRLVAEQLGVKVLTETAIPYKKMGPQQALYHEAAQPAEAPAEDASRIDKIHHHLKETGKSIHVEITKKIAPYLDEKPAYLALLFFLWVVMFCIYLLVQMGSLRVGLDLVDKNVSSYERVFSQKALLLPYVWLTIVYALLMIVIILGAIVAGGILGGLLGILLGYIFGGSGAVVAVGVGTIAGLVVCFKFMTRYIFAFYCLVDKKMGVHKALSCTYSITQGSVLKLIVMAVVLSIPFMVLGGVHLRIGQHVFNESFHAEFLAKLVAGVIGMWYILCFAYVYRKLGKA